jgi:hypothetical protein
VKVEGKFAAELKTKQVAFRELRPRLKRRELPDQPKFAVTRRTEVFFGVTRADFLDSH